VAIKSAYRRQNIPDELPAEPPNIPEVKIDGQQVEPDLAASVELPPEGEPDHEAINAAIARQTEADGAKNRLLEQLAALRQSEEIQRQHQAVAAIHAARAIPQTREEKLALWAQQGMTPDEAAFLQANPEMIDHHQVTAHAVAAVTQAGIDRETPQFFEAVRAEFDKRLHHAKAAGSAMAPAYFAPPAPRPPSDRSEIYSAPVAREVPTAQGRPREISPNKITLSPDERLIAKQSGISEVEYAKHKLVMLSRKQRGELQ
jgi:hypothetical protein